MIEILGMVLCVIGGIAALVGYIWIVAIAFQDHIGHGAACILCGIYSLIYGVMHWDTCSLPVGITFVAMGAYYGGARMAGI